MYIIYIYYVYNIYIYYPRNSQDISHSILIISQIIHPRETPHVRPLARRVHGTWRRVPSPCGRAWSSMWRMVSF